MDYAKLAMEFLDKMYTVRKFKPNQQINESMHGEAFVLQYIASHEPHEDVIIPSEISEAMCISSARIATTLNSLEDKGFITRNIDVNDRRRILIGLTPKGKKEADKTKQKLLVIAESMLRSLGEHDAKEYVRITGRMAELAQNFVN